MTPGQKVYWEMWLNKLGMDPNEYISQNSRGEYHATLRTLCTVILKTSSSQLYESTTFKVLAFLVIVFLAIYPICIMEVDHGSLWHPPPVQGGLLYCFYFMYVYVVLAYGWVMYVFMNIIQIDSNRRNVVCKMLKRLLKVVNTASFDDTQTKSSLEVLMKEYGSPMVDSSNETKSGGKGWFFSSNKAPSGKDLKLAKVPVSDKPTIKTTEGSLDSIDLELSTFQKENQAKTDKLFRQSQSVKIIEEAFASNDSDEVNATPLPNCKVLIPRLNMDSSSNINVWLYARSIMQTYGSRFKVRMDLYTGIIMTCLMIALVFAMTSIVISGSEVYMQPMVAPAALLGIFGLLQFVYSISIMADCNFQFSKHKKSVSLQLMVVQGQLQELHDFKANEIITDPTKLKMLQRKINQYDNAVNSCIRALDTINAQDEQNCLKVLGIRADYPLIVSISTAVGTVAITALTSTDSNQ